MVGPRNLGIPCVAYTAQGWSIDFVDPQLLAEVTHEGEVNAEVTGLLEDALNGDCDGLNDWLKAQQGYGRVIA